MSKQKITTKNLSEITGAPPYIIRYLHTCGRLPVEKKSLGAGYPVLYKPEAIEVVQEHLAKWKQSNA